MNVLRRSHDVAEERFGNESGCAGVEYRCRGKGCVPVVALSGVSVESVESDEACAGRDMRLTPDEVEVLS